MDTQELPEGETHITPRATVSVGPGLTATYSQSLSQAPQTRVTPDQTIVWLDYRLSFDGGSLQGEPPAQASVAAIRELFRSDWLIPAVISASTERVDNRGVSLDHPHDNPAGAIPARTGGLNKDNEASIQLLAVQLEQLGDIESSELGQYPCNKKLCFLTSSVELPPSEIIKSFSGLGNYVYITASYPAVIDCVSKGIPVIQVRNCRSDIP